MYTTLQEFTSPVSFHEPHRTCIVVHFNLSEMLNHTDPQRSFGICLPSRVTLAYRRPKPVILLEAIAVTWFHDEAQESLNNFEPNL